MNVLNIFYEHVFDAQRQSGGTLTEEEILVKLRGFGIEGLECDLWRLSALSEREKTKALFDRCGMRAACVYATFDFPRGESGAELAKMERCLETAAFFGADRVLAIPGFVGAGDDPERVRAAICERLSVMCEKAAGYNITVTLEDFDDSAAPYSDTAGLEYFLKNVGGLGLTFDTGNFAYALEDAGEAYTMLRRYIAGVHLKDRSWDAARADESGANGKPDLSGRVMYPCEVGGGFVGIGSLIERMLDDGYAGAFSIEHFGAIDQLGYAEKSAAYIKGILSRREERK